MERILILAVVAAIALARPESYKEKEDFQYSRSSSDDGSKSGFYGAQRGNMGGNYERSHNMDSLAQHQMSGLVHQVDGELGDGAKTRTGSVYSAASSRGVYGSGNYDLSNLAGRNFQEGEAYGDSQLQSSSLSSSAHNSAAYTNSRSHSSRIGGYQAAGHTSHSWQSGDSQTADKSGNSDLYDNLQAAGKSQSSSLYDYGQQTSQNSGYNAYGASDANSYFGHHGSDVGTRLISTVPVRIVVRPGTRVAIPIGTQTYGFTQGSSTYDADQRSSSYDANHKSSTDDANQRSYDQTSVIGEAAALSDANRHILYTPKNDAKHYESSYKYRKEWEKHDTIPATVTLPTAIDNSFPTDNELYEERQGRASNQQYSDSKKAESSNAYSGYNANVKSASSQSKYQSDLNLERHRSSSASNLNAYTQAGYNANVGSNGDLNSEVEDINSKPKSYHSSYSYHKSWERQGDPYVIKPASSGYYDDQSSQRLSAGTKNAFNSGSQHQSYADCDEVCGHVRVARSYDAQKYEGQEQLGQQAQNLEDFGQQSQNMEGFGQRSQNLEDFGQQSQNLEDFGQQSQTLEDFGQQSQNLEDFGQQSQNLEDLGQQNLNLENFGQQSQNLDKYSQQSQSQLNNLEDLGQRPQSTWEKYEDIGQQVQNKQFQNVAQETQSNWEQTEDLGQQSQHNPAMNIQDIWNKLETGSQNVEQESQNKWNFDQANVEEQHVQEHGNQDIEDTFVPVQDKFQEQEQSAFDQPDSYSQISQNENHDTLKKPVNAIWDKLDLEKTQSNNNLYTQTQEQSSSGRIFQVTQNAIKQMNDSLSKFDTVQGESHATQTDKKPTSEEDTHIVQSNSEHPKVNFDSNSHHEHPYFGSGFMQENSNNRQLRVNESQVIQTWNIDTTSQTQNDWNKLVLTNDSFSHHPPLLNLWNKLDNIQKQLESNYNKSLDESIPPSGKYTSPHLSMNKNENNLTHIQPVEQTDQIKFQDIGRGDIESEDLSIPAEMDVKDPTSWANSDKNLTLPVGNTGLNYINKQDALDQQNVESRNSSQVSILPTFLTNSTNIEQAHEVSLPNNEQKLEVHGIDTLDQENVEVSVQKILGDSLVKQENHFYEQGNLGQNNEHQNMQDFGYQQKNYQEALSKEKDSQQQNNIPDFGQQKENLEQQSIQDFGQQNDNLEQVNIEGFGQQSIHDFGQQNIQDFGQQSIPDFGQQNVQDFGQQSIHDFGQQNLQDFGQQSTHDFGQQNIQDFGQQSIHDFGQLNLQDFGQQSIHDFGQQNIQDFEQQNIQDFEQQNTQDVRYHNENLAQQNIQDFEQQNIQEFRNGNLEKQKYEQQSNAKQHHSDMQQQNFGQQRENYDQQNLHTVEQDNFEKFNQQENHKLEQASFEKFEPVDNLGQGLNTNWKLRPEKIEEKLDTLQNNLHSTAPKNTEIETPQEPVTEKPGFWKSVGSKFANAKDKVVSWFRS